MTAGDSIEEATYLSVYLERAARMQGRAHGIDGIEPARAALGQEAHDFLLKPSLVQFDYWCRQVDRQRRGLE